MEAYTMPPIAELNVSSSPPSGGTRTYHGTPSTAATLMSPQSGSSNNGRAATVQSPSRWPKNRFDLTYSAASRVSAGRNSGIARSNPPPRIATTRNFSAEEDLFSPTPTRESFSHNAPVNQAPITAKWIPPATPANIPVSYLLPGSTPDSDLPSYPSGPVLTSVGQYPGTIGSGPLPAMQPLPYMRPLPSMQSLPSTALPPMQSIPAMQSMPQMQSMPSMSTAQREPSLLSMPTMPAMQPASPMPSLSPLPVIPMPAAFSYNFNKVHGGFTVTDPYAGRVFRATNFKAVHLGARSHIEEYYSQWPTCKTINFVDLELGSFIVEFNDAREAQVAYRATTSGKALGTPTMTRFLSPKEMARDEGLPQDLITNYVGEYIITVTDKRSESEKVTVDAIFTHCSELGAVQAFQRLDNQHYGSTMVFRAEWADSRIDARPLPYLMHKDISVTVREHTPDLKDLSMFTGIAPPSESMIFKDNKYVNDFSERNGQIQIVTVQNHVNLYKICMGRDVRCTVMIRNIPNRVDHQELKAILDQTSRGRYDFMYLRIDFGNKCNVGYAFVNFADPMDIVTFAQARVGRRWNMYHSDKIAEISYATIQGTDALIQKFRNSSVMVEEPSYRPKLYSTGPYGGREKPFPAPDNYAKLRRSCENAKTLGLYHAAFPHMPGTSTMPAPRHQRAGGVYAPAAMDRAANRYTGNNAYKTRHHFALPR